MIELVIHRVNKISFLKTIPTSYGCEIDIRGYGSDLILEHEPLVKGELLIDFLEEYEHGLLILNIKEAGIEEEVLRLVKERQIERYFLLDVEFPYIYRATRMGEKSIAIRYSEDEPIELVEKYKDKVDWVWIDTNTLLPLDNLIVQRLEGLNTCLVCPERWGRPNDIIPYLTTMNILNFKPTAIMTNIKYVPIWEKSILSLK